jgi:hypothetical protein
MARNGRRTLIVRIADKLKLSPGITDSTNLDRKYFPDEKIHLDKYNLPRNNNKTIQSIPCIS